MVVDRASGRLPWVWRVTAESRTRAGSPLPLRMPPSSGCVPACTCAPQDPLSLALIAPRRTARHLSVHTPPRDPLAIAGFPAGRVCRAGLPAGVVHRRRAQLVVVSWLLLRFFELFTHSRTGWARRAPSNDLTAQGKRAITRARRRRLSSGRCRLCSAAYLRTPSAVCRLWRLCVACCLTPNVVLSHS